MLTRIIGIGSPFGADRLGWLAIDYLQRELPAEFTAVQLEKLDRPGTSLIEKMRDSHEVIIIDALKGADDGRLVMISADQDWNVVEGFSTHGFGLGECLALAETLGELPKKCTVCGISMRNPLQTEIPTVWLEKIADQVMQLLESCELTSEQA